MGIIYIVEPFVMTSIPSLAGAAVAVPMYPIYVYTMVISSIFVAKGNLYYAVYC